MKKKFVVITKTLLTVRRRFQTGYEGYWLPAGHVHSAESLQRFILSENKGGNSACPIREHEGREFPHSIKFDLI